MAICWSSGSGKAAIYCIKIGNPVFISGDQGEFTLTTVEEHVVTVSYGHSFSVIWLGE